LHPNEEILQTKDCKNGLTISKLFSNYDSWHGDVGYMLIPNENYDKDMNCQKYARTLWNLKYFS
jgi:hypothetical protein